MEITKEMYACSYKEVMTILRFLSIQDLVKIPSEKLEFFDNNMDTSYEYELDYSKPFQAQQMSPVTEAILANLYRDYLASPAQREAILEKERQELEQIEQEKREKFNPDDLFKKKQVEKTEIVEENVALVEYEESFLKRVLNIIKRWFGR